MRSPTAAEPDPAALDLADAELDTLAADGIVLRDGVLGADLARAARAAALALAATGALRPAGVSRGAGYRRDPAARGDEIAWLDPSRAPAGLAPVVVAFEALRRALNRGTWLGLARFDLQLARYQPGTRYVRHRDAFPGAPNRRVTAIYYLNTGWQPADGGLLRLFLPAGPRDVEPRADRLVVFRADRVEHEVLPGQAPRLALTAWYRARETLPTPGGPP